MLGSGDALGPELRQQAAAVCSHGWNSNTASTAPLQLLSSSKFIVRSKVIYVRKLQHAHGFKIENVSQNLFPENLLYSRGQKKRHPLKMNILFSLGLNESAYVKNEQKPPYINL